MRQAVFLVGGAGTRLGHLTGKRPKPFVEVSGRPFIDYLIKKAKMMGISEVVLLAGHASSWIETNYSPSIPDISVKIRVEPKRLGTAGALMTVADELDDTFLLLNGDSMFDANWSGLFPLLDKQTTVVMALFHLDDTSRYGRVECNGNIVRSFHEKDESFTGSGAVSAGIYAIHKHKLLPLISGPSSLERDILPKLVAQNSVKALTLNGYFIDIGIPNSLAQARKDFPEILRKSAVIFDRDNTLVLDKGYTHKQEDLLWMDGAKEAICALNNKGILVFVATNQAGIARGYYKEADMHLFHNAMQAELNTCGGHIDGFYFCPHHLDGTISELSIECECRKPKPGMLQHITQDHLLDKHKTILVGDKLTDVQAAESFGIKALQYSGGCMIELLKQHHVM